MAREHARTPDPLVDRLGIQAAAQRADRQVTRADVAARTLATEKASGAPTALLARSALSACLSWAMGAGLVEQNVTIGSIMPERGKSRERVLDGREIAACGPRQATPPSASTA